jgi:putative oxidoreductase
MAIGNLFKNTLAPLVIRIGLAAIFIFHGYHKVFDENHALGARWMPAEANMPEYQQLAVAWGELVGGFAMALGLLTRLAAIGLGVIMAGAIATVTGKNGFDALNHGYEYNFAIIVMCTAALLLGGGAISVDRIFRRRRKKAAA